MIANADSIRIPLADGVVQCVVTSPPYWGLRVYSGEQERVWPDGWRGGLGLEPTLEIFIEHLVQVFREVRRVMRDDGVAWVNMGDCYAQNKGTMRGDNETSAKAIHRQMLRNTSTGQHGGWEGRASRAANTATGNLKPKDLVMMPHRLALALQADGWWVRSDVVWAKPNPMPESLSGWRWEQCKVKVADDWQPCTGCPKCAETDGLVLRRGSWRPTSAHEYVFMLAKSSTYFSDGEAVREGVKPTSGVNMRAPKLGDHRRDGNYNTVTTKTYSRICGANCRSVWNIATQPFKGAHYATFPTALAQRCVLASTSRHACAECGAPWARVVEKKSHRPSCGCGAGVQPCLVLDPFCGSGTVGQVCRELPFKRDFVGIDLSFEYLQEQALVRSERRTPPSALAELPMFA